jgi:hypothetical protein
LTLLNLFYQNSQKYIICISTDGTTWSQLGEVPYGSGNQYVDTTISRIGDKHAPFAVDETNGRMFFYWGHATSFTSGVIYQTIPAIFDQTNWTFGPAMMPNAGVSQVPSLNSMDYVNFGTTATSGIVVAGSTYNNRYIFTIPAGTTTPVERYSSVIVGGQAITMRLLWNASSKRAVVTCDTKNASTTAPAFCTVTNDINQAWTAASMGNSTYPLPAALATMSAMSNQYAVICTARAQGSVTLYYSDITSGTWTPITVTIRNSGNVYWLTWNGTYWIMPTDKGLYYTANATPTGWLVANGYIDTNSTVPVGIRRI